MKTKVFCIGFHKTGTTSLETALTKLGYKVTGCFGTKDPDIANKVHEMAYAKVDKFDALQDNPWPILYRELDRKLDQQPGERLRYGGNTNAALDIRRQRRLSGRQ